MSGELREIDFKVWWITPKLIENKQFIRIHSIPSKEFKTFCSRVEAFSSSKTWK